MTWFPATTITLAAAMFLKAIWSQPFTEALHWLWTAILLCAITLLLYRFALSVQAAQERPIPVPETQPEEE